VLALLRFLDEKMFDEFDELLIVKDVIPKGKKKQRKYHKYYEL
jgi:hypothetical protein